MLTAASSAAHAGAAYIRAKGRLAAMTRRRVKSDMAISLLAKEIAASGGPVGG
jgi:hypothetical protein